jgi:hypothetical protein
MDPPCVDGRPVYTVATHLDPAGWSWQRRVIVNCDGAGRALFCTAASDKQQGNQQATTAH